MSVYWGKRRLRTVRKLSLLSLLSLPKTDNIVKNVKTDSMSPAIPVQFPWNFRTIPVCYGFMTGY